MAASTERDSRLDQVTPRDDIDATIEWLFDFEFRWVPNTYQARIQRAAVLYPLMGMAREEL